MNAAPTCLIGFTGPSAYATTGRSAASTTSRSPPCPQCTKFNIKPLHSALDCATGIEYEEAHYRRIDLPQQPPAGELAPTEGRAVTVPDKGSSPVSAATTPDPNAAPLAFAEAASALESSAS